MQLLQNSPIHYPHLGHCLIGYRWNLRTNYPVIKLGWRAETAGQLANQLRLIQTKPSCQDHSRMIRHSHINSGQTRAAVERLCRFLKTKGNLRRWAGSLMSYESVRLQSFPFHGFVFDNNSQCHSEQGLHDIKRLLKFENLVALNYLILLTISREGVLLQPL